MESPIEGLVVKHRQLIADEENWLNVKMSSEVKGVTAKQYDILRQDYTFIFIGILDATKDQYWQDKHINTLQKLHALLFSPEGGVRTQLYSLGN